MATKITSLTAEQWQRVAEAREHWLRVGLSTEPADRPRAEAAISALYRRLEKEPPTFIWWDSSWAACVGTPLLLAALGKSSQLASQLRSQLASQLRSQLASQLYSQLASQLYSQLDSQLYSQLASQLASQLDSQLYSQLYSQLDSQLDSQLASQLYSQLASQLYSQLDSQLYSQLDSQLASQLDSQLYSQLDSQLDSHARTVFDSRWSPWWLAWHAHCASVGEIAGLSYTPEVRGHLAEWMDSMTAAGWWFPFEKFCAITERPERIKMEGGRLHCADGPAIAYRDNWRLWFWRGTNVPREWIEAKDKLDPKTALTWQNVEQRRAAAEILGWDRILSELQPRVIQKSRDPLIGTLLEVDLPDAPASRFLRVRCGTGREFCLPVPRECKTARAANAWTFDLKPTELKLEART